MRLVFFLIAVAVSHATPPKNLDEAWKSLNSEKLEIRTAAREAIEASPIEEWLDRALLEYRSWAGLEVIRAVCNKLPASEAARIKPHLCEMITTLPLEHMSEPQLMEAVTLSEMVFEKLGRPTTDERRQMVDLWKHIGAKKELSGKVRDRIEKLMELLRKAS